MSSPFSNDEDMAAEMSGMFTSMVMGFKASVSKVLEDPDYCDIIAKAAMKMKKAYIEAGFSETEAMFLLARITDSMSFNSSKKG